MIPRYNVAIDPRIPPAATFWVPTIEELDDSEGHIGDFHDSQFIETDIDEARQIVAAEQVAVEYADANATTAEDFEAIAEQIEFEFPDLPTDETPPFIIETAWYGLGYLELGVAGLSYALNAVSIITGASCRSHARGYSPWTDHPVVIFAANRRQMELLQPHVQAAECGFEIDDVNRAHLVAIGAPSVLEMMALATRLLVDSDAFLDTL